MAVVVVDDVTGKTRATSWCCHKITPEQMASWCDTSGIVCTPMPAKKPGG
jgi:hypothetical protein